jgi:hypothetical protein
MMKQSAARRGPEADLEAREIARACDMFDRADEKSGPVDDFVPAKRPDATST